MSGLEGLGLDEWLVKQCQAMGITKPSPIQTNCIPPILEGLNCVGCAKTGSGKTAAFALPILQKLSEDRYGPYALVLTPTRELAFQIADQFKVLGKEINVNVIVITGGMDMVRQGQDLTHKPHIVVSTPGRLADHYESCDMFSLKKIKFLVLDEADRLLEDEGFAEQLQIIFKNLPEKRQTLLFSATMTPAIRQLQEASKEKVFSWSQSSDMMTVDELDQRYVLMNADVKDAYLMHILDKYTTERPKSSIIIFTSTCKYAQILALMCDDLNFPCVSLHSMMPQKFRLSGLTKFKSDQIKILIATDVASRGLDIPTVDLIINHNVPNRPRDYVHRVGRTARAGRGGMAITLVTQFDVHLTKSIEAYINTKLTEYATDEKEVLKLLTEVAVSRRQAEIRLDERDFGEKRQINKRKKLLLDGKDPDKEEEEKMAKKKMLKKDSDARNQKKVEKEERKEKFKNKFKKKVK
ncbi:ATP-dependent RNA helicase DDX49 [Biomphalaria glabrata]|uniref:RNA helicase n=1 Tax=Biomphalaria glabrata TaxID=6526 RepID=A0A2C9K2Q0_BIOGL|nr:putative ATP-dependent RNA helicase DDX49 [Biomphalaria glabrata]KAI8764244.1 ATP-dependent RNA helicase DDX49 [Biomphalaria glabrata]